MPVDDDALTSLAAHVGAFHITDKAMRRAQRAIEEAIERNAVDDRARAAYLAEVHRYFDAFGREARAHLRDVDRRLVALNQTQFNLTAERGVAVKRIEATEAILSETRSAQERAAP